MPDAVSVQAYGDRVSGGNCELHLCYLRRRGRTTGIKSLSFS